MQPLSQVRLHSDSLLELGRRLAPIVIVTAIASLPALLLGGLAIVIRPELAFSELGLGAALAAFYGSSAIMSVPIGAVSERVGPTRAVTAGLIGSSATLLGIAGSAHSWLTLVVPWLALGGISHAAVQVGANHLLAVAVPRRRLGIAYGTKQSGIPLAALIAGFSLPVLGLTIGWRWGYALAGVLAVASVAALRLPRPSDVGDRGSEVQDGPRTTIIVLSAGAGLGTAAATSLGGFIVASAVSSGFEASSAGLLLIGGSFAGILARLGIGWAADHSNREVLPIVASLLMLAAVGYVGLAATAAASVIGVLATLAAFAGGWGYQGLVLLAVARANPVAPGGALAIVRVGPTLGAVLGPLTFGALAEAFGFSTAWHLAAASSLAGATLVLVGRWWLRTTNTRTQQRTLQ